jgi:hypothetical protein
MSPEQIEGRELDARSDLALLILLGSSPLNGYAAAWQASKPGASGGLPGSQARSASPFSACHSL